jgi:esterase/lipase superfamily enzyme
MAKRIKKAFSVALGQQNEASVKELIARKADDLARFLSCLVAGVLVTSCSHEIRTRSPASVIDDSSVSSEQELTVPATPASIAVGPPDLASERLHYLVNARRDGQLQLVEFDEFQPPKETAAPSRELPKPTLIKLFFATSRRELAQPIVDEKKHPRYFGYQWRGGEGLAYGVTSVTIPTDRELPPGEIEGSTWRWLSIRIDLPDNPRDDVWLFRPKMFANSNEFFTALSADIPKRANRSLLVGVHGYNNSFEFAGRRLAKMVHDMNYHGTPVLYSWPAGDGVGSYGHDEDRIREPQEQEQFADFLEQLVTTARAAGTRQIDLVAHSMGNRLLASAAYRFARTHPGIKIFDNVVMAAPDIAKNDFSTTVWPRLQQMAAKSALYVSAFDKALFGSQVIHPNIGPRLGHAGGGPLVVLGLQTIDASEAKDTFIHHDHHLRLSGICDLSALLIKQWTPERRVEAGILKHPEEITAQPSWYLLLPALNVDCFN